MSTNLEQLKARLNSLGRPDRLRIAKAAGVCDRQIDRIRNGEHSPRLTTYERLNEATMLIIQSRSQ